MSHMVFRNTDTKAIKALLKEIGEKHYKDALKEEGIDTQPPLTMKGFYLEYNLKTGNIGLFFKYPTIAIFIMPVLGYWSVPDKGWEMKRVMD